MLITHTNYHIYTISYYIILYYVILCYIISILPLILIFSLTLSQFHCV
jgi:hypothetical protein